MLNTLKSFYHTILDSLPPDPLPWSILGFTAALATLQLNITDLSVFLYIIIFCSALFYIIRDKFSFSKLLLFITMGALIGCLTLSYHNNYRISQTSLKKARYNIEATGIITDIKDRGQKMIIYRKTDRSVIFNCKVASAAVNPKTLHGKGSGGNESKIV